MKLPYELTDAEIDVTREDAIHLLVSAITREQLSLTHILHAEGEKIEKMLMDSTLIPQDLISLNNSVERSLRNLSLSYTILHYKLDDLLEMLYGEEEAWAF